MQLTIHSYLERWDTCILFLQLVACEITDNKVVYKLNLDLSVEKMHNLIKILDDYTETRVAKGTQDVR